MKRKGGEDWFCELPLTKEQYFEMLRRLEQEVRESGLKQEEIAVHMRTQQPNVSRMLSGKEMIGRARLRQWSNLLEVDVRSLMGLPSLVDEPPVPTARLLEKTLTHDISEALGMDWNGLRGETWLTQFPNDAGCIRKIIPICETTLEEVEALSIGADFLEASQSVVRTIMALAEKGRVLGVPHADRLLFTASDTGRHCLCYVGEPETILDQAREFLLPMYDVLSQSPGDKALRMTTYSGHGDVLKVGAKANPALWPQSRAKIHQARQLSKGRQDSRLYPATRSYGIVAAHEDISRTAFDEVAEQAEADLPGHEPSPGLHCRDGLLEMATVRFEKTGESQYADEVQRHLELYGKESAKLSQQRKVEWDVRGRKAVLNARLKLGLIDKDEARQECGKTLKDAVGSPRLERELAELWIKLKE